MKNAAISGNTFLTHQMKNNLSAKLKPTRSKFFDQRFDSRIVMITKKKASGTSSGSINLLVTEVAVVVFLVYLP